MVLLSSSCNVAECPELMNMEGMSERRNEGLRGKGFSLMDTSCKSRCVYYVLDRTVIVHSQD